MSRMFEKFAEVRNLSVLVERGNALTNGVDLLPSPNELELSASLQRALYNLSFDERKELSALLLFGRDYVPGEGENTLTEYGKFADAPEIPVIASDIEYLSDKPIAQYLTDAEDKLMGRWPEGLNVRERHNFGSPSRS